MLNALSSLTRVFNIKTRITPLNCLASDMFFSQHHIAPNLLIIIFAILSYQIVIKS